jgi:hypothetical protein
MARTLSRHEVDRFYDDDLTHLVIVTEVVQVARWNSPDSKAFTRRIEKRVRLTPGESELLRSRTGEPTT